MCIRSASKHHPHACSTQRCVNQSHERKLSDTSPAVNLDKYLGIAGNDTYRDIYDLAFPTPPVGLLTGKRFGSRSNDSLPN